MQCFTIHLPSTNPNSTETEKRRGQEWKKEINWQQEMRPPTHEDYRLDHTHLRTQVTQKNIVLPTFNPIRCEEKNDFEKPTSELEKENPCSYRIAIEVREILQDCCASFCKLASKVQWRGWKLGRLKVGCLCRLAVLFVRNKQRLARMQRKKGIKKERKNERKDERTNLS